MSPIISSFGILLPLFGLILAGFILGRAPIWSEAGTGFLTNYVFYLAIPALLFRTMAGGAATRHMELGVLYAYFGGCVLVFGLALLIAVALFPLVWRERAIFAMGTVFSNNVMLGIPLIVLLHGDRGLAVLSIVIAFNSVILIPLTTLVAEIDRSGSGPSLARLVKPLKRLALNPVILGILVGVAYGLTGLGIPVWLDRFLKPLADSSTAGALVSLGATLSVLGFSGAGRQSWTMVVLKLVVHPAAVWLCARYLFGLDPTATAVITIMAALPVGSNVFILAKYYDSYVAPVVSATLTSTALAAISIAVLIGVLAIPL